MSATFIDTTKAALADRRVHIGGAAVALVAILGGLGVAAAARSGSPPGPDLADRAGLAVVMQPGPGMVMPKPVGKLATLDPEQEAATRPEPIDPALKAMLLQERQEDARNAAEQRAFDTRLRAELNTDTPATDVEPPAPRGGSTSNSEDVGETSPA